jgi:hypothetical protein
MNKNNSWKVIMTLPILTLFGMIWIRAVSPKPHLAADNRIRVVTDHGLKLASFFDGLKEIDHRLKPSSPVNRILTRIDNSPVFHFLGLSPLEIHAQSNCNGSYQTNVNTNCPSGCGSVFGDTGTGMDMCTGFMNEDLGCTSGDGCNGRQQRAQCTVLACAGWECVNSNDCAPGETCNNHMCHTSSPIILDVQGDGFSLTDAQHGVDFDFFGTGKKIRIAWTSPDSDDAWLVLDRDGDGLIDSGKEMFGNITAQPSSSDPNGFLALAEFDKRANGGNEDGVIDSRDAVFPRLRLWQDKNHDGVSQSSELSTLVHLNVESIDLHYQEAKRVDQYGNAFRFRSKVDDAKHSHVGRWAYDVFLMTQK